MLFCLILVHDMNCARTMSEFECVDTRNELSKITRNCRIYSRRLNNINRLVVSIVRLLEMKQQNAQTKQIMKLLYSL